MLAEVKSGQVDYGINLPTNLEPQISPPAHAVTTSSYGFYALTFNNEAKPLSEVGVRRAISQALDREQIAKTVYNSIAKPLAGFWPQTMTGYDPSVSTTQDLAAAKRDLVGTSCEAGCRVNLLYTNSTGYPQAAVIIQNNLKRIGITVELNALDDTTFGSKIDGGKYQMSLTGLFDYSNIPDGLLIYGLLSNGGLQALFSRLRSTTVDEAVERTLAASTAESRAQAMAKVEQLFVSEAPYATLCTITVISASRLSDDVLWLDNSSLLEVGRGN